MKFVVGILIAIAGLVLGWIVAAFGTLILGSAFELKDFEGERAMVAFFAIGPVGGLFGCIFALWMWLNRASRTQRG